MPKRYDDKMKLNMPFSEALERFAAVDPKEMHANIKRAKSKKPPGGKNAPPGNASQRSPSVISLRDKRKR